MKKLKESKLGKLKEGKVREPHYHDSLSQRRVSAKEIRSDARIVAGTNDNVGVLDGQDTTWRIYAGNNSPASAPFRVNQSGQMTATDATLTVTSGNAITIEGGGSISLEQGGDIYLTDGDSPSEIRFINNEDTSEYISIYKTVSTVYHYLYTVPTGMNLETRTSIDYGIPGATAGNDGENAYNFFNICIGKLTSVVGTRAHYFEVFDGVDGTSVFQVGVTTDNTAVLTKFVSVTCDGDSFSITQDSTTGACPVMVLDQDDADQAYINFTGGTLYTGKSGQDEYLKVERNGNTRYIRLFN